jgi:hydroxylamine reductase
VRVQTGSLTHAVRTFSLSTQKVPNPDMFCRQCEQTKDNYACTSLGVCGKTSETAAIQDALIEVVKSVATWAVAARAAGASSQDMEEANVYTLKATFSTLTNVNFSEERIAEYIHDGMAIKNKLAELVSQKGGTAPTTSAAQIKLASTLTAEELEDFGRSVSIPVREELMGNEDCFSLNEIATYGLKGVCAYATHCYQLGAMDEDVMASIHEVLAKLSSNEPDMDGLLANVLRVGEISTKVLGMLDGAHASTFGNPEITQVCSTAVKGKAILVSGHDMKDLHALLEQTEGTGINVFTHGEMMPAHSYPELKKFKHLVGNYGTAWQNQKFEFAAFPGPIVMTTNCIIEPRRIYKDRIYSMNEVGFDGVKHIGQDRDFSDVIEQAKKAKGFPRTIEPAQFLTIGFNHRVVVPLADKVIEAAKSGDLSRIFLIGGCDGSQWERSYFTDLAEETPDDSLILTLGCAKNRLIHSEKLEGATLANGLPRVLDMGQCNDSYSAVVVATELAKALDCSINDLPLSLAVSHLEQKAAAVLLCLLHLGVKNIRLGPSLPAYITPNVLKVLADNYNLMPTGGKFCEKTVFKPASQCHGVLNCHFCLFYTQILLKTWRK